PEMVKADYVITESGGVPIPTSKGHVLGVTVGETGAHWRDPTGVRAARAPGPRPRPFPPDNAPRGAAEVVRRIAAYQSKTRILDVWREYVKAMDLGPELTRGLTDPERLLDTVRGMENLALAREAHACTHTTFSPNVIHGGVKTNVIPDRVEIDVDIRALPGVTSEDVDAMLAEALGDLAPRVTIRRGRGQSGSLSTHDTPLVAAMERVTSRLMPGSRVVPKMTTGGTDAKFWRWQ